ncbi:MAG: hypothetical protein HRT47_12190 [Candidatus Caenarcaniphilales bacterium]|nr:hypothetical protein [Candidatus Caenarcaniphilales bacterium]
MNSKIILLKSFLGCAIASIGLRSESDFLANTSYNGYMHKDVSILEKDIQLFYQVYKQEIKQQESVPEINRYIQEKLTDIKRFNFTGKQKLVDSLVYALGVSNYNNCFDKLRKIYKAEKLGVDHITNNTIAVKGCRNQLTAKQSKWINLLSEGPKSKGKLIRFLLKLGLETLKNHASHSTIMKLAMNEELNMEHIGSIASLAKQQRVNFFH